MPRANTSTMPSVAEFLNAPREYVVRSRWSIDIPITDLSSFLFTSPTAELSHKPVFLAAEKPDTHNLSLHSFRRLVKKIAQGLRDAGLVPGQRVLVFSGNNVFYPSLFLGVIAAGGIFTGANPAFTTRELAFQLKDSGASFCIANAASIGCAVEAADHIGLERERLFVFDDGLLLGDTNGGGRDRWTTGAGEAGKKYGVRHWSEIVSENEDFEWKIFTTMEEMQQTAAINYSSGTTGVPKGVEITHWNFIAQVVQFLQIAHLSPAIRKLKHVQLGMLPMYHAFGQVWYVLLFPALETQLFVLQKFEFLQFLKYLEKYEVTSIAGVPPIMIALVKHPAVSKFNLSHIRTLGSGAAPLGKDIVREVEGMFQKKYGTKITLRQGWGMTEATCHVLGHHPEDQADDQGAVGELMPNCEGKVVDLENENIDLPAGVPGELYIRAPIVCKGYWNNPKATAETFTKDGWLKTGDIAYYSRVGKFYIVDRKKELIKVRGMQVAPAELEGVLLEHPKIADVGVIGVPFAGDERPRAYIVPVADSGLTEEDVTRWVSERCTEYKWITGGVQFVAQIPKNPSGKILRRELRARAAMEVVDTGNFKAKL